MEGWRGDARPSCAAFEKYDRKGHIDGLRDEVPAVSPFAASQACSLSYVAGPTGENEECVENGHDAVRPGRWLEDAAHRMATECSPAT